MKNFIISLLIILSVSLFAGLVVSRNNLEELNKHSNETKQEFNTYKQRMQKFEELEEVMQEVDGLEYTENYKCEDFSREMVSRLAERNIQAEVVYGESPKTLREAKKIHAWIGLWIEPQTGQFTKNYVKR